MGDERAGTPNASRFLIHEVSEEERLRYRESPSHSILKTTTSVKLIDSGKKLTFADAGNGSGREKTPIKEDGLVKVAVSPTKMVRVSPQVWKAHQRLTRMFDDYPNETEKTDYSYSPLSPYHEREIIPGVTMPPNMSRPAIRSFSTYASPTRCVTPVVRRKKLPNTGFGKRLGFWDQEETTSTISSYWFIILLVLFLVGTVLELGTFSQPWIVKLGIWISFSGKQKPGAGIILLDQRVNSALHRINRLEQFLKSLKSENTASSQQIHGRFYGLLRAVEVNDLTKRSLHATSCRFYRKQFLINYEQSLKRVSETREMCKEVAETRFEFFNAWSKTSKGGFHSVQQLVESSLRKYDADKTGLTDYALEISGGRVVSIRCTQPWPGSEALSFDPRAAIRSGVAPGECWAFQGEGRLVLELSHAITITGCSIEHISPSIHPYGFTASAPRDFLLLGLKYGNDTSPHFLGRFIYEIASETVQTFSVRSTDLIFRFVEIVILNNHGHPYTCLYRVRIHGSL